MNRMLGTIRSSFSWRTHVIGEYGVTMNDLLISAPDILKELAMELTRRGDEEYRKDQTSQASACFSWPSDLFPCSAAWPVFSGLTKWPT
jgi:hypothetical protein